jgi:hypothetical protein
MTALQPGVKIELIYAGRQSSWRLYFRWEESMSVISKILIGVGLLTTIVGNVMTYSGVCYQHQRHHGLLNPVALQHWPENWIPPARLVWLVSSGVILILGIIPAASTLSAMRRQQT